MSLELSSAAADNAALIRSRCPREPKIAIILGSGLGDFVGRLEDPVTIPYYDVPGFPVPVVSGHAGALVLGEIAGVPVAVLSGRSHFYEQGDADAMRPALETLKALGIEVVILTNAAGSVTKEIPPGSVMLIADHINLSARNPLIGEQTDARFVGMTRAYDLDLMRAAAEAAEAEAIPLSRGVYMWFSGPSFETPAEIRAAAILGASAVGMSTVPEVILARFLGLRVLAFSVITNFAAGMTEAELSHDETKSVAPVGGEKLGRILARLIATLQQMPAASGDSAS